MLHALLLLGISKAPLNTTIEFVGFDSMMGLGRAYVLLMFLVNLGVLQVVCPMVAKGETEPGEVMYGGFAIQFCEFVLSATLGEYLGVFSIVPIFLTTVLLLAKLCGMSLRGAGKVASVYYAYHVVSLFAIRLVAAKFQ